ncbi:LysR substrate-binding domain-containing protein [Deinococcus cellulosilyticus]|uniref:Transcriptional regulator n=1 Tax=Deinococcus cellulosilyticus (strain DSM 18568 / NBRC 106333 / KACC 11606 / 5516J-15) TaxID=1223518 RepID=A0A511N906_DEIC1|nr:LysR substrate-binding domain-containing protein [Deinococcus cellulosilyticus]GEM49302.1 transcriptional regulator [Deinococcus cellulosilyticus NBRC 106333 = KACC 11606]
MNLNPDQLITFLKVAELGNLSLAASQLNLTQPAVSSQLKLLTERVGEPLFRRHRYGVSLTPAGEHLLPHAHQVQRALDGVSRYLEEVRQLEYGTLQVAASLTIAATILPVVLSRYHTMYPQVRFQVTQGNTRQVLDLLLRSGCELALMEGHLPELPTDLHASVFQQDRLVLVASAQHPLARKPEVQKADLQGLPVIWREVGSGTREAARSALLQAGIEVKDVLELAGTEAVKEAVMQGLGAAFLSEWTVQREVQSGHLVQLPLSLPGLTRDLRVVGTAPELLSRAARTFLELLQQTSQANQ